MPLDSATAKAAAVIPLPTAATSGKYRFVRTGYANLVRDRFSRMFFMRAKVGGRKVVRSLKTKSLEVAKRLLDAELAGERELRQTERPDVAEWRMRELANEWLAKVQSDRNLKPRAKDYRRETWKMICNTWPELSAMRPARVTVAMAREWAGRLRQRYSATRYNGALESLRALFRLAGERGLVSVNVAMQVKRLGQPPAAKRTLPPAADFRRLLKQLAGRPDRRRALLVVKFFAYCGARPAAMIQVRPGDVDLRLNRLTLPPVKHQHAPLVVPMSPDLRRVVKELLADHPGGRLPLLPIKSPKRALATACRELGWPVLQPYDLRRLYATHLLESGVPASVVAALRGDKDGGALVMKTYFSARAATLAATVKRIKW